jgi:uncharacterized membrane protein
VDVYLLALTLGIGFVAGLRSLLAPAAVAWAVRLGWLNLHDSPFAFIESNVALATFSLLSTGELIADLLPNLPRRTAPLPLLARILSGGFCGACLFASVHKSWPLGAVFGAVGGVIGAFAGYEIRRRLVSNVADWFVALSEDLIALTLAWFCVSR